MPEKFGEDPRLSPVSQVKCIACTLLFLLQLSPVLWAAEPSDWSFQGEEQQVKVWTRSLPNSDQKEFRGEVELPVALDSALTLFGNLANFKSFIHTVKRSDLLESGGNGSLLYLVYDTPWPLDERDVYVHLQRSGDKMSGVLFTMKSDEKKAEKSGLVRMRHVKGLWRFQSTGNKSCSMFFEQSGNPGGNIPDWLAKSAIMKMPVNTLANFRKLVTSAPFGSD